MTKSGDGEKVINTQMMPDYACCDDPGYFFISSPLNVYPIGRSDALVLYVEGGCPPFTWAASGSWATFGTAETAVRYNTLESGTDVGADVTVTVTDLCSEEVTISVPWTGAKTCCEDPPAFSMQTLGSELNTALWPGEAVVFLDGGCKPFSWSVEGVGYSLDNATTNSRRNRLAATAGSVGGRVTVEDYCGTSKCVSCDFDFVANQHWKLAPVDSISNVTVEHGKTEAYWDIVDNPSKWFVGSSGTWTSTIHTSDSAESPTLDEIVTLRARDACLTPCYKTYILSCSAKRRITQFKRMSTSTASDVRAIKLTECNLCVSVGDRRLRTFAVDTSTGSVGDLIDEVQFTAHYVFLPVVIEILDSGTDETTIVAVAWAGTSGSWIATYTINNSTGDISDSAIDEECVHNVYSTWIDVIHQRGQVYVAGVSTPSTGLITGIGIDGVGNIATDYVHSHLFTEVFQATRQTHYISLCKGTYDQDLVVAYQLLGSGDNQFHGFIDSWDIEEGGIGAASVGSIDFANVAQHIDVARLSYDNDGYVVVYNIDVNGGGMAVISQDADNNLAIEATYDPPGDFAQPTIVHLQNDCFGILNANYSGGGWTWNFMTMLIDTFGDYAVRYMYWKNAVGGTANYASQIVKISSTILAGYVTAIYYSPNNGHGMTTMEMYCNE